MKFEHIFDEMEIDADPFALCELRGQCTMGLGAQSGATLHYFLAGRGQITFQGHSAIDVEQGTLALVPMARPHTLRCFGEPGHPVPECRPAELDLASHLLTADGDADTGKLLSICSHVSVGLRGATGLVNLVREPIVEVVTEGGAMQGLVGRLLQELSSPTLGSKAMIRALLLQCMIHLLRSRLQAKDPGLNWMAALVDENLWSALQQMLEAPGNPHSVESLADTAGMSRSAFASRFSAAYGKGPMELLRELRMHLAASLLAQSDLPVKRIAELAGFQSRSAFTRTFASTIGASPHQFRSGLRKD